MVQCSKTWSFSPGDNECSSSYNTLKAKAWSFSTICSDTSNRVNAFVVQQISLSPSWSCCDATNRQMSSQSYKPWQACHIHECHPPHNGTVLKLTTVYYASLSALGGSTGEAVLNCPTVTVCCVANFAKFRAWSIQKLNETREKFPV